MCGTRNPLNKHQHLRAGLAVLQANRMSENQDTSRRKRRLFTLRTVGRATRIPLAPGPKLEPKPYLCNNCLRIHVATSRPKSCKCGARWEDICGCEASCDTMIRLLHGERGDLGGELLTEVILWSPKEGIILSVDQRRGKARDNAEA